MINLLIAGDEQAFMKSFLGFIPWNKYGYNILYFAKSVSDIHHFFERNYADIVIYTMKIPLVDILEEQQKLNEKYSNLPFLYLNHIHTEEQLITKLDVVKNAYNLTKKTPLKTVIDRNLYKDKNFWDFTNYEYLKPECENDYFCILNIQYNFKLNSCFIKCENKINSVIYRFFNKNSVVLVESSIRGSLYCIKQNTEERLNYKLKKLLDILNQNFEIDCKIWKSDTTKSIYNCKESIIESLKYLSHYNLNTFNSEKYIHEFNFNVYQFYYEKESDIITDLMEGRILEAIEKIKIHEYNFVKANLSVMDAQYVVRSILFKYIDGLRRNDVTFNDSKKAAIFNVFNKSTIEATFQECYVLINKIADYARSVDIKNIDKCISLVKQYIISNFTNPYLTLKEIASKAHFNATYLSAEFSKREGITINGFITKIRIEKAKHMLISTDKKIFEISDYIGYINPTYFSTTFRKVTGTTPRQFRDAQTDCNAGIFAEN